MADSLTDITDEELHQRLARFGHNVTSKGKMTEAQRQIQKKKLNHLEAKERAEREKAEKEAAKREKEEKEAAKRAIGSPPPKKKARTTTSRRRTVAVAVPESVTPERELEPHMAEPFENEKHKTPLKSPVTSRDKQLLDANTPESSPLVIHVVDTSTGNAADAVPVTLSVLHATRGWFQLAERRTNTDGECPGLITKDLFQPGLYRIQVNTEEYFKMTAAKINFPQIEVAIHVQEPGEKFTISVLLMPFAYTTTVVKNSKP